MNMKRTDVYKVLSTEHAHYLRRDVDCFILQLQRLSFGGGSHKGGIASPCDSAISARYVWIKGGV